MFKGLADILVSCVVLYTVFWIVKFFQAMMMVHKCCQRVSYLGRRTVNPETISFLDNDPDIFPTRPPHDQYATSRYYRHVRHPSSEGFAEVGCSVFYVLL